MMSPAQPSKGSFLQFFEHLKKFEEGSARKHRDAKRSAGRSGTLLLKASPELSVASASSGALCKRGSAVEKHDE